jgi:glycosyltransferase involved in cell wall biosynthesis
LLFSIVVATRNRAAQLLSLVRRLYDQIGEVGDTEIVIVDNRSTDDTRVAVERLIQSHSNQTPLRYFYESQLGLSPARNAGVRVAQGKYVIFIDDDVEPEPGWLEAYRRQVKLAPNLRAAGGPIEPRPEPNVDLPLLDHRYLWVYGHLDYGEGTLLLNSRQTLHGGNMLFNRTTFLELGGLADLCGHRGDSLGGGEEHDLLARVRREFPISCYYVGKAKVYHRIPGSRATREWVIGRIRGGSQAIARFEALRRSRTVVALKSIYYFMIIAASRVLPISQLRRTECSAYLDGLRSS